MRHYLVVILLSAMSSYLFGQEKELSKGEQRRMVEKADYHMQMSEYREAFNLYTALVSFDASNANYHYGLGLSVFEGSFNKIAAMPSFEKAYSLGIKDDKPEIFYYLGRVYQFNQNFVAAIAAYNTFIGFIQNNKAGRELRAEVESYIDQSEKGKTQLDSKKKSIKWVDKRLKDVMKFYTDERNYVKLINLGKEVNSKFSEYGAVFFDQNQVMLFTSRKEGTTGNELYYDGQYFEDIYVAENLRGNWTKVININASDFLNKSMSNSKGHDATVSASRDGKVLFIYHDNKVQQLRFENNQWTVPQGFSEQFKSVGDFVTSASLSPDNRSVYIVTNQGDSYGGQDIYVANKQADGSWGELENMGEHINTKKNEEAPFLLNDTTLYFSSQGHSSIGGYDVFVSYKRNGKWSKPQNLEIPINSPADEINYNVSENGEFAYYASNRDGGYGEYDIYKIVKGRDEEIDYQMLAQLERENTKQQSILQGSEIEILLVDEGEEETLLLANEVPEQARENATEVKDPKRELFEEETRSSEEIAQAVGQVEEVIPKVEEKVESAKEEPAATVEEKSEVVNEEVAMVQEKTATDMKQEANDLNDLFSSPTSASTNQTTEVKQNQATTFREDVDNAAEKLAQASKIDQPREEAVLKNNNSTIKKDKPQGEATQGRPAQSKPAKESEESENLVFNDIQFTSGSSELSDASKEKLKKVAQRLVQNPHLYTEVIGHADNVGTKEGNKNISRLRALKAYNYLLKLGVLPDRIYYSYAGDDEPLFPNDTPENKSKNRRIEASAFKSEYTGSIPFGFDKAKLGPRGESNLEKIISVLQAQAYKYVYVVGHTDDTGPNSYNQELSEKRAKYIEQRIMEKMPQIKVRTMGVGEDRPRVMGMTYEARETNRRVEVIVVE